MLYVASCIVVVKGVLQLAAKLALPVLYMLQHIRLSVCHTPVLCQNEGMQKDAV